MNIIIYINKSTNSINIVMNIIVVIIININFSIINFIPTNNYNIISMIIIIINIVRKSNWYSCLKF